MITPANDQPPAGFEEEAASWCWRIAEGALSPEDQLAFDTWLHADPRHRETFADMVTVWQGTDAIADMPGFLSLRAKALTSMESARDDVRPSPSPNRWRLAIAAAVAILLLIVTGAWWQMTGPDIYRTGIGERRVVRLDDGSRISLDASSRLSVDYSGERRALILEQGRAKFDVAKDPLRPFTVTAGQKTVIATGTAFSVELLRDQVRVLLYEGHVAVLAKPQNDGAAVPVMVARRNLPVEQLLKPGNELVTDLASPSAAIAPADIQRSLSWEAGRLSFTDEPLASAVERVNRYSDIPIVIGDAATARHVINGVFDAGDTSGFVSGVMSLYPVSVRRETDRILLVDRAKHP